MKTLIYFKYTLKAIRLTGVFCCLGSAFASQSASDSPTALLQCPVTYAGSTQVVEARPVSNPYPVPSVDIGGRFRFKAVMVGKAQQVESITLYAYLDTSLQPVMIHQGLYLPPYHPSMAAGHAYNLTGYQHLYAGPMERELIYHCTLQGVKP